MFCSFFGFLAKNNVVFLGFSIILEISPSSSGKNRNYYVILMNALLPYCRGF